MRPQFVAQQDVQLAWRPMLCVQPVDGLLVCPVNYKREVDIVRLGRKIKG